MHHFSVCSSVTKHTHITMRPSTPSIPQNAFHPPEQKLCTHDTTLHSPLATTNLLSVSVNLTLLGTSRKEVLQCLSFGDRPISPHTMSSRLTIAWFLVQNSGAQFMVETEAPGKPSIPTSGWGQSRDWNPDPLSPAQGTFLHVDLLRPDFHSPVV